MKIGRRKFIILLFAVIIVTASAGSFAYVSTPRGCLTCHEMKPFYDTWKASAHQELECHKCHVQDIGAYIKVFIKHLQGVNASEIEAEPPISPSNQQCLACHKSLPSHSEEPSDISCLSCHEIEHYEHIIKISDNYDCSTCHDDHTMTVDEETCESCHGVSGHGSDGEAKQTFTAVGTSALDSLVNFVWVGITVICLARARTAKK